MALAEQSLKTIDIERRGYGRRYTGLPVDALSRDGCTVEFAGYFTRPAMIDIQPNDTVRWREGDRTYEATILHVERGEQTLNATFGDQQLIPTDQIF